MRRWHQTKHMRVQTETGCAARQYRADAACGETAAAAAAIAPAFFFVFLLKTRQHARKRAVTHPCMLLLTTVRRKLNPYLFNPEPSFSCVRVRLLQVPA